MRHIIFLFLLASNIIFGQSAPEQVALIEGKTAPFSGMLVNEAKYNDIIKVKKELKDLKIDFEYLTIKKEMESEMYEERIEMYKKSGVSKFVDEYKFEMGILTGILLTLAISVSIDDLLVEN